METCNINAPFFDHVYVVMMLTKKTEIRENKKKRTGVKVIFVPSWSGMVDPYSSFHQPGGQTPNTIIVQRSLNIQPHFKHSKIRRERGGVLHREKGHLDKGG